MAHDIETEDRRNPQKNKADNLMPKRMNGFDRRRNNVFHEPCGLSRNLLAGHGFILSKGKLVPACPRLYNQGNISTEPASVSGPGNRWPCTCISMTGKPKRESPNEGGLKWKNV
jgi:hypothetical protein